MKRVAQSGRRTWVYVDPHRRHSCVVWGGPRPFGGWDPWAVSHGFSAFEATCYRNRSMYADRIDGDRTAAARAFERVLASHDLVPGRVAPGDVVYAFYSHESKSVKVGRTTDLHRRWKKLEHESGQMRQLVAMWRSPDSRAFEHELHMRWLEFRVFGEWFTAEPVLADLRQAYARASR